MIGKRWTRKTSFYTSVKFFGKTMEPLFCTQGKADLAFKGNAYHELRQNLNALRVDQVMA